MKKKIISLFLCIVFMGLLGLLTVTSEIRAATVHTIPDSNLTAILNAKKMRMTKDNVSYKWNTTGGKVFHDDAGYEFAFPSTGTSGFRKQNSLTLNFTNVMTVNGRQVDAEVIVTDLVVGNQTYTDEDGLWTPGGGEDGYISFLGVYENGISVGICRNGQRWMPEDVTLSTSFQYHDSGEKITSVPVYQTLADIDAYYDLSWNGHAYKNIKNEAWQGVSGYTGEIYQFDSCRLVTDLGNLRLSAPKNSVTSGSDSYTITGAIVTVNQDTDKIVQTFTSTYCATEMMFYSPLDDRNLPTPAKTADNLTDGKEKIYDNGQTITWNVSQKVHTWNADIFSCYTNMSFADTLPAKAEYQSAKFYHNDKDVTSEYGTLKYDNASHTVTYNLNRNTINKTSFYDGGTLRLEIKTKAVNNTNQVIEVLNKAATITNSIKQEVEKKVKINYDIPLTVTKAWQDGNDADGIRPDSINVKLVLDTYMGSTKLSSLDLKTVTLSADNWSETVRVRNPINSVSGGPLYTYKYRWEEVVPEGYTSTQTRSGNTTTITNKYNPETVTVTGIKAWEDNNNQDGLRLEQIDLTLQADGEDVRTFTLNENNNWRAEYTGFKFKEGKEVKYTWTEKNVPDGYKVSQNISGYTTVLTNTHEVEKVSLKCVKKWEDCDNQDGLRPKTIEIALNADGNNAGKYILSDENNWEAAVSSLDKYKGGKEIKYTWVEKPVTGYTSTQSASGNTTTITNAHIPEKVSINVIKTWQDENDADGIRPDNIDVTLLADGTDMNDYSITKEGRWKLTVENLDKYKNGKEIIYIWQEKDVTGYTADIRTDGYDTVITNSHDPKYAIVTEIDQGTITETETDIPYGADRTVKWIPADGRYVSTVTVDGKDVSDKESFTFEHITADHIVKVTTLPYHVITTKIDNGLITERIEKIKDTESKIVSWTPEAGYYVTKVTIDGVEMYSGNKVSGYPTSHAFDDIKKDYDIQIETKKIPNLTITKESDKDIYNVDDEVTYTITAKQTIEGAEATNVVITDKDITKGLEFDLSTVSCNIKESVINTKDNSFTVLIDRLSYDKEIIITVKGKVNKDTLESKDIKNTATIISDQTEEKRDDADIAIGYNIITNVINGTITESSFNIPYGADKTISYLPDKGHYLVSVKADGENLDMKDFEKSYDFKNINANHLIEVEYAPYHKVTTEIDQGTITEDKTDIKTGEDYTVTWTPADGRYVKKVTVNGIVHYEGNTISGYPTSYDFSNITEDQDIKVETALIPEETTVPETTQPEETVTQQVVLETTAPEETIQEVTVEETTRKTTPVHSYNAPQTGGQAIGITAIIALVAIGIGLFMLLLGRKKCNKRNGY